MSAVPWRVWALVSAGKFLEGLIVFMGGLTLPLAARELHLGGTGLAAAAPLLGILLGAPLFGALADRWGRRPVFIGEMGLLLLALVAVALSPNGPCLLASLLLVGLALGADYPMGHLVLSERSTPQLRAPLVLSSFGFQALGVLSGGLFGLLLGLPAGLSWRQLYLLPLLPVALLILGRLGVEETPDWCQRPAAGTADLPPNAVRTKLSSTMACQALVAATADEPSAREPQEIGLERSGPTAESSPAVTRLPANPNAQEALALLSRAPRSLAPLALALACLPWFLQDLATYGIGIHLPRLLVDVMPAGGNATLDTVLEEVLLVAGIGAATLLCRWVEIIPQQIAGFCGCSLALALAAWGARSDQPQPRLFAIGLGLFLFATNLGPNATTYLLAGNLFPVEQRARGAGLAASAGKGGAVLMALLVPLLLEHWGVASLLAALGGTSLLGAALTWGLASRMNEAPYTDGDVAQHANEE